MTVLKWPDGEEMVGVEISFDQAGKPVFSILLDLERASDSEAPANSQHIEALQTLLTEFPDEPTDYSAAKIEKFARCYVAVAGEMKQFDHAGEIVDDVALALATICYSDDKMNPENWSEAMNLRLATALLTLTEAISKGSNL